MGGETDRGQGCNLSEEEPFTEGEGGKEAERYTLQTSLHLPKYLICHLILIKIPLTFLTLWMKKN